MNILEHNRQAWNRESAAGSEWCTPVDSETILTARNGQWDVILTPTRKVPKAWFGNRAGKDVLCLASGGGQQAPVLAAAGAHVVSYDLSEEQLGKDAAVARRENLTIRCIQGDMANLSILPADSVDLIFHPCSNTFVPDVAAVWREYHRVLRPGGDLLAGFVNPSVFLFDHEEAERTGQLIVRYKLPYSEPDSLNDGERKSLLDSGRALEFGHTLETQIGGQIAAGFAITGLYEDGWTDEATPLNRFAPVAIATRATNAA